MASIKNTESDLSFDYRPMTVPVLSSVKKYQKILPGEPISSDRVVEFLENRSPIYEFEYSHVVRENTEISLGYEVKSVDEINAIYVMINPDLRNLALVPSNSLVISHHKISCYDNRIYKRMLEQARTNHFNIYNFHLAWDTMEMGIGDSFLLHLKLSLKDFDKVDLTYKGHTIRKLGAVMKKKYPLDRVIAHLNSMKVSPSVILNPSCNNLKIGYIPGGGFVDRMIIEMADFGVDVLISSDHNWVVETIAREVGMTLVEIDHYASERYGLQTMQNLLTSVFPKSPTTILENVDDVDCSLDDCACCATEIGVNIC